MLAFNVFQRRGPFQTFFNRTARWRVTSWQERLQLQLAQRNLEIRPLRKNDRAFDDVFELRTFQGQW